MSFISTLVHPCLWVSSRRLVTRAVNLPTGATRIGSSLSSRRRASRCVSLNLVAPVNPSQLSDAVAFLRVHHNAVTLVTVDLGFNTLNVCFRHLDIDLTCVTPQLTLLRQQLGQVMRTLTRAAGPHVAFVGLGHYNPYLTKSTSEGAAETFAGNSVVALHLMNLSLSQVYGSFKISLADVSKAFHEEDTSLVRVSKKENTTANVQYECRLTWMCAPKPFGPNIHPNDAGYLAIAKAVAAVLPPRI